MSTIELDICPHEAGTIITLLTEELTTLRMNRVMDLQAIEKVIEERNDLQAEIDGMNAGANLSGETVTQWRAIAIATSRSIDDWLMAIEARLDAVDTLNSIDGETVRANLTPFINTIRGLMNTIDAHINNSSQEDN